MWAGKGAAGCWPENGIFVPPTKCWTAPAERKMEQQSRRAASRQSGDGAFAWREMIVIRQVREKSGVGDWNNSFDGSRCEQSDLQIGTTVMDGSLREQPQSMRRSRKRQRLSGSSPRCASHVGVGSAPGSGTALSWHHVPAHHHGVVFVNGVVAVHREAAQKGAEANEHFQFLVGAQDDHVLLTHLIRRQPPEIAGQHLKRLKVNVDG